MKSISVKGYIVDIHVSEENSDHLVYLHTSSDEGLAVWQMLDTPKPALAVISGTDWNRDFSPWPAPKVFAKGEDFSGGAEAYLKTLLGDIIPVVESVLPMPPRARSIAGYSLAGLFALWCGYRCDAFDGIAAMSPSAWFDGFVDFVQSNPLSGRLGRISLSLGDREIYTRNARMKAVSAAMETVRSSLANRGISVSFRSELGGHFDDIPGRVARGIAGLYTDAGL